MISIRIPLVGVGLGLLLVLGCLIAGNLAAATTVPPRPALAQDSGGQSRCGTVSVGQSVVLLGQTITASAARGGGWTSTCGDTWDWGPALPVGKTVSGCRVGDKICKIKTTALTGTGNSFSFLAFCIEGVGGLEWESCDLYIVVPKGALIEGRVLAPDRMPVAGVKVSASGPAGGATATTASNGQYVLVVKPGTYKVAPTAVLGPAQQVLTSKAVFQPASVSKTAAIGRVAIADFVVVQQNTLSIEVNPAQVDASGLATVQVTITETSPATFNGPPASPVVGARIVVEPPVEVGTDGVVNAVLCDSANNLASPIRLHDGSLLGTHFWATTNSAGQVQLTLYVGTLAGKWVIDAYQPGPGGAPLVSAAVDVAPVAGRSVIDPQGDLLSQLIATGDNTLLQKGQSLQRNVLEWLGEIDSQLQSVNLGVGFAPIYAVDATGATHAGVVIFAPGSAVRQDVLDYLDGLSTAAPSEDQAWVIDVSNLSKLLATGEFTGNIITHVQYRLPSLQVWDLGEKVVLARGEDLAIRGDVDTLIPVAGRGRAHFGLVGARGNESMLYGYGPYLPAPSSSPGAVALEHCVGGS